MNEHNPWKTLASKHIYKNPWINLREDQVIRPDGESGIYGVVEANKIATGVVAITPNNEIYLVGQYRYPMNQYSWEIIEGGAEPNEPPLEAIKRELLEEAGLVAKTWITLGGEIHLSNCFSNEIGFVFLAKDLEERQSSPEGTEVLQVKKLPLQKCLEMIYDGGITDAMSIIGIHRAEKFLNSTHS